jgi:hypothetical protein
MPGAFGREHPGFAREIWDLESGPYFVMVPTPSRPSRGQRRTLAQVALPYICRLIPQNEPVDIAFGDAGAW